LKQNWIKSEKHTGLKLETLDALIKFSLTGLEVDAIDWSRIYSIWKIDTRTHRRRPLSLEEVDLID